MLRQVACQGLNLGLSLALELGILAAGGTAITAVYILRLLARAFFGPLDPRWEHVTDATPVEVGATSMLVLALVFVGIWPLPLMNVINVGVEELLMRFPGA